MAEEIPFSPLDPLGPEYGRINAPVVDAKGLSAFEGDMIKESPINFPTAPSYQPILPGVDNLDRPNRSIQENIVRTNANNPSIPKKKLTTDEIRSSANKSLKTLFQVNQDKNDYGKIFSYNAGPDGNAFYKRYHAYGQETFDRIGFSPLRDNEAAFNAQTTKWDDFSRMWTHSFVPLLTTGFTAGPKSLFKALQGDFTSGDLEDARRYEEAAAIGQSSKGGVFGFVNNTMMNFGYTAGIMGEAIAEELVGTVLAAPTGGSSLFVATANNLRKAGSLYKVFDRMGDGYKAVKTTLQNASTITGARKLWEAAKSSDFLTSAARGLNPLENTREAVKQLRQADNITDLAILSKTAGGFYRDVRKINMALSEARLEAGMVENSIYDKLYNEAYKANGNQLPSNKELAAIQKQAKEASLSTLTSNVGLIYASNAITFNNITGPRGGLRNFIKSTTEDVYEMASKQGSKNFGSLGKVVYDRSAKAFELQKNNIMQLAKNWIKNPGYKTLTSTVGYFKANFTEGFQENLQEVIAGANEKYYIDSYKSPTLQRQLYSMGVIQRSMLPKKDYFSKELAAQFSGQGLETFASGFFMGTLAGPVNNAIPFLSTAYNRMFNKEEYANFKKAQLEIANGLVDQLNKMDLKTFMTDHNLNLGAQDLVSKVRQRGTKKEALDAETEAYVSQINKLRATGTLNLFTEKIQSFKDATDKELADALGIKEEQAEKYRARLDKAVERMNRVNAAYDRAEQKYPNPVDITQLTDPNAPDFNEKVLLYNAWNQGIKNMVFFNETYDDILSRREAIKNKYNTSKNFQSIDSYEKDLLYQPEKMYDEMELLDKEIALEKELGKNPKKLKQLEERKNALNNFFQNYLRFDVFFNREDYADSIAEELQKETGKEPTTEEILKRMDQKYGSLDNETQKTELIKNLNKVHNEYLKTLAGHKGNQAFDEDNSQAFELLMNYYKMGMESKKIAQYINLMNDPQSFLEAVRRNTEWMRKFTAQRVKYFEDLIHSEMGKVRDNAFLNALADKGYYLNAEDMENYLGGKNIPPKEIYNHITKEVYPQGSKEYNEIYKEYFQKRADLKAQQNPRKTGIVATAYERQIQDLKDKMEQEIADLPTELVKINQEPIGKEGETLSYEQITQALEINEYAELTYQDGTESIIIFKDGNNDVRYNNAEGDFVDIEDLVDTVFTSAVKFDYEARPDENLVKAIRENYENKIKEVEEAYIRDNQVIEDEIPFEEITQDDNINTADLREFRNMLYDKFVNEHLPKLPEDIQDLIAEDQELEDFEFEKWYKLPENKKYFDEYNQKNKPKGQKTEAVITFEGQDINTKDLSLDELTRYRDRINTAIDEAEDDLNYTDIEESPEETKALQDSLRELKKQVKAINSVIQLRQFANFSPAIKDGVRKIQKLLAAQKGVEERYLLTEDDPTTGLKEGQVAYRVNGLIHRRVTNAMQDVLGKEYEYGGKANVEKAYNLTIGKSGLNDVTISDFITQLNALLASRTASYDPLPGANEKLVLKLQDELSKLSGLSPEEIKIEREKDKLFQQSDSILRKLVAAEEEGNATRVVNLTKQKAEVDKKLVDLQQKLNALKGKGAAPASSKITDIERRKQEELNNKREIFIKALSKNKENPEESILKNDSIFTRDGKISEVAFRKIDKKSDSAFVFKYNSIIDDINAKYNAELAALKPTAPVSSKIVDNSISNGDKIISVQTKPVTDEIVNSDGELFITADKDPEGKIYINMEPLKNVLVVPNNTLTIIDKTTGEEIVNQELNSEGAVIFEAMQGRLFVVANVNGQLIPFYKSSSGTDGKTQGAWYPFFGYTGSWLVKGGIDKSTGKMGYSPEIDKVTTLLNENLIFPDKYINRVTNNIKNNDGEVVYDFNNHFKVNRIWQKAFQSSTGTKSNYKIKGLKENTKSESGVVALITGLNSTELDSSDTPKELSEWFNLISKKAELGTSTAPVSEDIEAKVAERVKRYSNRPANRMQKFNPDGDNTDLNQGEIDEVEKYIESAKKAGWNVDRTFRQLSRLGYTYALGNTTEAFKNYLKDRLSGETNIKVTSEFNINEQIRTELAALGGQVSEEVLDEATKKNTTKDIILNFFAEETYQDSRDAGNFIDDAKDYLESGSKPKFDKAKITQEAYDSLFNDVDGYLTQIKRKVDSGEFYLIGRDLVVYDSNIVRPDGTTDRIAGEIDLLLATDKGIMIVDIKSGEMKKWQGFNSLSKSKDKKVFTKREEYTLQQAAYATMLEKMIDAPVAAIALLPVQRSSNKDTDQMVTAGKPETLSIYGKLEYQYDADGKPVKNDAGESVFTLKNERASDWLVPLYRESVQDKIDMLFPPGAVKFVPGMKTAANKQFKIFVDAINKLSNEGTKANLNALSSIEKSINEFVAKNNIPISTELSTALEAKRKAYGAEASKNTITNTISKYQNAADNSKASVDRIAKRLGDIKSLVVFDNIDLSPESDFISEQLASDPTFKERYEVHEKYFIDSMGEPTVGQELAAHVLNQSGILTDEEYAAVEDGELNMSEISELIHESVKRIQYIKVNSENDAEAKKFTDYQRDILNLMANTKWNESNAAFLAVLTNAQDNVDSGDVVSAINSLDAEIARTELGLENTRLKDYQKKNLNERLTDLTNFKNAIIEVTGYTPIEEILTEVEEEIESEEIDLDGLPEENILKVGDKLYSKSGTFVEYTVTKINKDNTVELKDENGKKVTTTMDKINEEFLTQDQILGEDVIDTYVPTPSEVSVTKESQDTVDSFIKNEKAVGEGYEEGVNNSAAQLRIKLLNKTKYCP